MKKHLTKAYFLRLFLLLVGLTVAHLGVTLFLLASLGSDPFTTMVEGISLQQSVLSLGTVHMCATGTLIVLMAIFTKGYIRTGTFVCTFFGGPIIDLFTWMLGGLLTPELPFVAKFFTAALGCIILSAGMSLAIRSEAGLGANDLVAVILTDKLKKFQFRWVRMACDVTFMVIGFILGGTVGVGTVIAVCLIGPTVQFCHRFNQKIVDFSLKKCGIVPTNQS